MNMNMKETKNMRRLIMCRSLDATTSCMIPDCRSVIRSRRSSDQTLVEHTRLLSNTKYIRLAEGRGYVVPASRRSLSSSSAANANGVKLDQNALPLSSTKQVFQVVVMRVSIHCQGCAGKVKKHLSKMEGVTSFSVDLETKRVTVMGHVSPVAVLESMSKVKKAEFWAPNLISM
ncbi:putative heavy metal-associated domain, HMA, heavy metal-associated domain superfamily [Helianthus annuus]|nr:putative heavy metal-associated domain, HMA, heavy metal-associated domain superfamily [Helianthus annuus]KAJ0734235.1 putative heavy metal-associated domain, HMA, heavy metal-associated domain superfamily [Helianthus annuus]KAJ0870264.1 putative heavy metal-associated domain, HMA, heavy metal-associated domain superfamily [Helianthus annuus]